MLEDQQSRQRQKQDPATNQDSSYREYMGGQRINLHFRVTGRHGSYRTRSTSFPLLAPLELCDETVAAAGYGFDESWIIRFIAQCRANLVDGEVDAAFKIDKGVVAPDALVNFLAGDDLSVAFDHQKKDSNLLRPEFDHVATLAQLAIGRIELKWAEADYA